MPEPKSLHPLFFVSSLQPAGVQSERHAHLFGQDQSPEPGPLLCLQRRVSDLLERLGCGGDRALPDPHTVSSLKTQLMFSKVHKSGLHMPV